MTAAGYDGAMSWLVTLVLILALFFFARWFVGWGVGAPYLPIRARDIQDAFTLVSLSDQDVVVDLGSGDGRILLAAVERGARVIGYELNPFLAWISRWRLRRFGSRAVICRKDLRRADLSSASVVFIFGITSLMPAVTSLIQSQTQPLQIVSFAFDLPGLTPVAHKGIATLYRWK